MARLIDEFRKRAGGAHRETFDGWILTSSLHLDLQHVTLRRCAFAGQLTSSLWEGVEVDACHFAAGVAVANLRGGKIMNTEFDGALEFRIVPSETLTLAVSDCTFRTRPTFTGSHTRVSTLWTSVRFLQGVVFSDSTWERPTIFQDVDFGGDTSFARTDVSNLTFRGCKMSGVSFSESFGVAEADFDANDWRHDTGTKYSIREDLVAQRSNLKRDFESAERAFREIRRSLEAHRHFSEAIRFADRELEMRRLAKGATDASCRAFGMRRRFFSLEAQYYHLARYGSSVGRPLLMLTLIVSISPFVLAIAGINLGYGFYTYSTIDPLTATRSYIELLAYSLRSVALVSDPQGVQLLPLAQVWGIVLRVVGPFFALLVSIAVRRHFRR